MQDNYSKFITKIRALREEWQRVITAEGGGVIKDAVKQLFDRFPQLEGVRWTQYTPYFNDGDPCEFSFGSMDFMISGLEEDQDIDMDGDWLEEYDLTRWNQEKKEYEARFNPELVEALKEFSGMISGLGDALEFIFGDHSQVSIRRGEEELAVDDYDHD